MNPFLKSLATRVVIAKRISVAILAIVSLLSVHCPAAFAQLEFEKEPFNYGKSRTTDPITDLQKQIDAGDAKLDLWVDQDF